jgi:hypothetical protein
VDCYNFHAKSCKKTKEMEKRKKEKGSFPWLRLSTAPTVA